MNRSSILPLLALLACLACSATSFANRGQSQPESALGPFETRLGRPRVPLALVGGSFEAVGQDSSGIHLGNGPPGSCVSDAFRCTIPPGREIAQHASDFVWFFNPFMMICLCAVKRRLNARLETPGGNGGSGSAYYSEMLEAARGADPSLFRQQWESWSVTFRRSLKDCSPANVLLQVSLP